MYSMDLTVFPGIFHPAFFGSSKVMLSHLALVDLSNLNILDMGCGSGVLAIYAAKQGALVVAADANRLAVENTRINARENGVTLQIQYSDVFTHLTPKKFDVILCNPPYFAATPPSDNQLAWYAGHDLQFFDKFFRDLRAFTHTNSRVWMILSEVCDMPAIGTHAAQYSWSGEKIFSRVRMAERFFVIEYRSQEL